VADDRDQTRNTKGPSDSGETGRPTAHKWCAGETQSHMNVNSTIRLSVAPGM